MARKNSTLAYVPLMALGILGIWFGYKISDPSNFRFWLGPLMTLIAAIGLIVVFRRELFYTEQERKLEWKRMKDKGKLKYLLIRPLLIGVLWGVLTFAFDLFDVYVGEKSWDSVMLSPREFVVAIVGVIVVSWVWALILWYVQERKYANSV
jgi:hypothetical protein